jgi:hypothetical protein
VWRLYKTDIGLTTGFIGSHTVTHNYSVYIHSYNSIQFIITLAESSFTLYLHWFPVFQYRRIRSHSKTDWLTDWLKSKSHYDRQPVGQGVLVSSPVWGSWPDVSYCLTLTRNYIARERTPNKTPPRNRPQRKRWSLPLLRGCWLLGNALRLLTSLAHSVHVTLYTFTVNRIIILMTGRTMASITYKSNKQVTF